MQPTGKFKGVIRFTAWVLGAGLLGGLGNGIWEKILSPMVNYTQESVVSFFSWISKNYSDSIYVRASRLNDYGGEAALAKMFVLLMCVAYFYHKIYENGKVLERYGKSDAVKNVHRLFTIAVAALLLTVMIADARNSAVERIRNYSVRNMEIVRPYVGEHKYLLLRSEYLRIKNENDYLGFLEDLYSSARQANIQIEEFSN